MRFLDTNVLIYAVCGADEDADKQRRAISLLTARELALADQALEFLRSAVRVLISECVYPV